jgi:hypothetical protein
MLVPLPYLSLNANQKLPAISNSIQLKEDVSDYYLKLFFIDVHLYKIMKSYKEPISTASEASRFEISGLISPLFTFTSTKTGGSSISTWTLSKRHVIHLNPHITNGLQDIISTGCKPRLIFDDLNQDNIKPKAKISKETHAFKSNTQQYQVDVKKLFMLNK